MVHKLTLLKNHWFTLNWDYLLTNIYRPIIKFEDRQKVVTLTTKQPFNIARKDIQNMRTKKKSCQLGYYSIIPFHIISSFSFPLFLSCYLSPQPKIINKFFFFWTLSPFIFYLFIYLFFFVCFSLHYFFYNLEIFYLFIKWFNYLFIKWFIYPQFIPMYLFIKWFFLHNKNLK